MPPESNTTSELLFLMADAIVANAPSDEQFARSEQDKYKILHDLEVLSSDNEKAGTLIDKLFTTGLPSSDALYRTLYEVSTRLHFGDVAARVAGFVWSETYRKYGETERVQHLRELPKRGGHDFFVILNGLPTLLGSNVLSADFASSWFVELHERIANDGASGGFWSGLEAYGEKTPNEALKVLEEYLTSGDDRRLSIAACLLGTLRSLPSSVGRPAEFAPIDAKYVNHRDVKARLWYARSWIYVAMRGQLGVIELQQLLSEMEAGTTEEQDERFNVVCKCLGSPKVGAECEAFALSWLRAHTASDLSPSAKYAIADLHFCDRKKVTAEVLGELLLAIQPIAAELLGIWKLVEYFLVEKLKEDFTAFQTFFKLLAEKSAAEMVAAMSDHELEYILGELKKHDTTKLITELILSGTEDVRRLGLFLFDELESKTLSPEVLNALTDVQLEVALLEMQRMHFDGDAIGRFLRMLVPSFERRNQTLRETFRDELVSQAKNYPGGCFKQLKEIADTSELVREVIKEVDQYFEALRKTDQTAIRTMEVEELEDALVMERRRFSATMSEGMRKHSPLLSMIKTLHLVYGRATTHYQDGHVGDSSPLQKFETQYEMSRLEMIDPETMALRRLRASSRIAFADESKEPGSKRESS